MMEIWTRRHREVLRDGEGSQSTGVHDSDTHSDSTPGLHIVSPISAMPSTSTGPPLVQSSPSR